MAANVIRMLPGPTRLAVSHAQDIKSSFDLFMPSPIKRIILDCTNLEGSKVFGERWKVMDETVLDAYFGVLILAGGPMGRPLNPCGMKKLAENFSGRRCLWKRSK